MEIVNTFYLCALQGNTNLLKELQKYHSIDVNISDRDGTTPLILASANNQFEMVAELLKMGSDPNKVRKSGTGPLFFACQYGYLKVVELLIKFGANVNQQNSRDHGCPLLVAAQNGHTLCVDMLLQSGADVDCQLRDGASALFLAAQSGHVYTLETLLRFKADANLFKKDLTTPLYIASQMGHHKIVKRLLEFGAEVDAAREDGSTSLFKAAQKGHRLVIEALLKKGASTRMLANGETALHMAALFGRTRITHLLLVNGADPFIKNKEGLSSSDLAKEAQFGDLVTVLQTFESRPQRPRHSPSPNVPLREPYTAPASVSGAWWEDDLSSQCSDTTTTTTTTGVGALTLTSGLPHLSAPTPLHTPRPFNKLYSSFLPPSTEEELIAAIEAMAKPSVVQNDTIKQPASPERVLNHHHQCEGEEETPYLLDLPAKLEKLLVSRHSNPEIREIEEFRRAFSSQLRQPQPTPCDHRCQQQHQQYQHPQNQQLPQQRLSQMHPNPMLSFSFTNSKPVYLRYPTPQTPSSGASNNCCYVPPLNPPPPLPIPPQIVCQHSTSPISDPGLFPAVQGCTVIVGGRRKMSQPNLKTFQYDK